MTQQVCCSFASVRDDKADGARGTRVRDCDEKEDSVGSSGKTSLVIGETGYGAGGGSMQLPGIRKSAQGRQRR